MKNTALVLLLLTLFLACQSGDGPNRAPQDSLAGKEDATAFGEPLDTASLLRPFDSIPGGIQGCSALFAADSLAFARKQYLFVGNLQGQAFIQLEGRVVPLQRKDKKTSATGFHETYEAPDITVEIVGSSLARSADEVTRFEATLTVVHRGRKTTRQLFGEVGC